MGLRKWWNSFKKVEKVLDVCIGVDGDAVEEKIAVEKARVDALLAKHPGVEKAIQAGSAIREVLDEKEAAPSITANHLQAKNLPFPSSLSDRTSQINRRVSNKRTGPADRRLRNTLMDTARCFEAQHVRTEMAENAVYALMNYSRNRTAAFEFGHPGEIRVKIPKEIIEKVTERGHHQKVSFEFNDKREMVITYFYGTKKD